MRKHGLNGRKLARKMQLKVKAVGATKSFDRTRSTPLAVQRPSQILMGM
jgi:hypothetical protein